MVKVDGRRIDDVHGTLPLMPASTEKLLTATAMLAEGRADRHVPDRGRGDGARRTTA